MNPIIEELQKQPVIELNYEFEPGEDGLLSINKLYTTGYKGKRTLNSKGKALRAKIQRLTAEATLSLLDGRGEWRTALSLIYEEGFHVVLLINLYWARVHNGSWKPGGSTTEKGDPRSPYQKKDATNYIKLIEDGIARATGIDDSAHLLVAVMKHEDELERVSINYRIHE